MDTSTVHTIRTSSSSPASARGQDQSLVHSEPIPPAVSMACDSATVIVRETLSLAVQREEGSFLDSPYGRPRTGCRLRGKGSFKALKGEAGPVDGLQIAFTHHHWRQDFRYGADGPDGSVVGMRFRDMLCLADGRWQGDDESDTVTRAPTPEQDAYDVIIECARDIASNADAGVPDSIWNIAKAAGFDGRYAILTFPPHVDGDFDGDGVSDAAVLVENRSSGKLGIVIIRRGTRQVSVVGAGAASPGPDDLSWVNALDVFRKGSSMHLTIKDRPTTQLLGDALWAGAADSVGAFYVWTGHGFAYEPHRR